MGEVQNCAAGYVSDSSFKVWSAQEPTWLSAFVSEADKGSRMLFCCLATAPTPEVRSPLPDQGRWKWAGEPALLSSALSFPLLSAELSDL